MPIPVKCPACEATYNLGEPLAGKTINCPKCQGPIVVPAAPTVEVDRPAKSTQVKSEPPPKKPKTDIAANKPTKPAKKKATPKQEKVEDDSPFALPTKKSTGAKAKKGGCSGIVIAILLVLGLGFFGCVGAVGLAGWWIYGASQQELAELKKNVEKKKNDPGEIDKEKKKDTGKRDDADKNKTVADPKKDDLKKDENPKDMLLPEPKKEPPPPGIAVITLAPDGTAKIEGALADADPKNKFGRTHKEYELKMEAGKTYQIDLIASDFHGYLHVYDSKKKLSDENQDGGGNGNARIIFLPKTTDTYRIHATHFDNKTGPFTLTIRRTDTPPIAFDPKAPAGQEVVFGGDGTFSNNDMVGPADMRGKNNMNFKPYVASLDAGSSYEIEMRSAGQLNPALIVMDPDKKAVAETQMRTQTREAVLLFRPERSGNYQIQACALAGKGPFTISIRRCDDVVIGPGFRVKYHVFSFADELGQVGLTSGIIWAKDGKSFYAAGTQSGTLFHTEIATRAFQKKQKFDTWCSNIAMSAEGLVLTMREANEIWVVDPDDIGSIKKKIPVRGVRWVGAGADSKFAVACVENGPTCVVDLRKGTVISQLDPLKNGTHDFVQVSQNGRTVIAAQRQLSIERYRFDGVKLILEEIAHTPVDIVMGLQLSPDDQYVTVLGRLKGGEAPVFHVSNLKKAALSAPTGNVAAGLGAVDPKSGWLFGSYTTTPLIIYPPGGAKRAQMTFPTFQQAGQTEIAVSPSGGELLLRGFQQVAYVKLHTLGEPLAKIEMKKDNDPIAKVDPKKEPKNDPVVKKAPAGPAGNIEAKDVTHRVIAYKADAAPMRSPVWAPDGKSFYVLCKNGQVQRINADSGEAEKTFNIGRGLNDDGRLGMSSEGLVVSYPGQILVIDLDLAGIKKKINPGDISNCVTGSDASVAVVVQRGAVPRLGIVDLEKGVVVNLVPFKLTAFNMKLSADGKYLFVGDSGRILRYRVDANNVAFEENSPVVVGPPGVLNISLDGKHVCLAGGPVGTPANHPERGQYIYAADNLKRPFATLTKIDSGKGVGVDMVGGWIYASDTRKPLVVFSLGGTRKGEFQLPGAETTAITEYVVSPLGRAFLIRTPTSVIHVKIGVEGGS